jgi:single-strand DNA-binding protein
MANVNVAMLIGRMVADPELKQTPNGVAVTSFSIAVNRRYTKGEEQQADFINIVAWRNTAEFIAKYFKKGSAIFIKGAIQTRSWTDQNGNKRFATEVVADEAQFVEAKKAQSDAQNEAQGAPYGESDAEFVEMTADEDLPF